MSVKKSTYSKHFTDISFSNFKEENLYLFFSKESISLLSNSTKNIMLIILYSIIDYGIKNKYKKEFKKPNIRFKKEKNKVAYFTKKEQSILVKYLNSNLNLRNIAIILALYTGIRIDEICALKWNDIDFTNNTLSINKTVQRIKSINNNFTKTKLIVDNPKTISSDRIIPLPKFLISILKKIKKRVLYFFLTKKICQKIQER